MASEPEPLSWLTLERYALGELSESERAEVEARLAESESDRACLASILDDMSELPPLPKAPLETARQSRRGRWVVLSSGLCAAAAALLLLVRAPRQAHEQAGEQATSGVKGSEVGLRLLSERRGADPHRFSAGERFKLEVTCPPDFAPSLRVLILQGEELFEPLTTQLPRCGNLVPWPGAFALDGSVAAQVCLYWGRERTPSRGSLAHESVCSELQPE